MNSHPGAEPSVVDYIHESLATITALLQASALHNGISPQTRNFLDQVDSEVRDLAGLCDQLEGDDWNRRSARGADAAPFGRPARQVPGLRSEVIPIEEMAQAEANRPVPSPLDRHTAVGGHDAQIGTLTRQERRILALIALGYTNRQIGHELFLAEKTVKNYVSNLLRKLGLERRTQAAVYVTRLDAHNTRGSSSTHPSPEPSVDLTVLPSIGRTVADRATAR